MSDLKDYIDSDDPNYFWRLSSGQHENLLDGAIECIERAEEEIEQLKKDKDSMQAKIDSLMFEYCPDEMTKEQIEEWVKHQVIAGKYTKED